MTASRAHEGISARHFALDVLHLFVLSSFAIAQPWLDILGRNAEFFVTQHSTSAHVVALTLLVVVAPPVLVAIVEVAAAFAFGDRVRRHVHLVAVAGFLGLTAWIFFRRALPGDGSIAAVLAGTAGLLGAVAYRRVDAVRTFVTVLAPAPLVFASFFLTSQVPRLLFGPEPRPVGATVPFERESPIVMMVFDEFPTSSLMTSNGQIDAARYPRFAELAQRSTWFRNATTVSELTQHAGPALLSGNMPHIDGLPVAREYPRNLFTLLGGRYAVDGFPLWFSEMCPPSVCAKEQPNFRATVKDSLVVYGHLVGPEFVQRRLPRLNTVGIRFATTRAEGDTAAEAEVHKADPRWSLYASHIDGLQPQQGSLAFFHVFLPHSPWTHAPSGRLLGPLNGEISGLRADSTWVDAEWPVIHSYQRHLLQVGAVDALVGKLMDRLDAVGRWDESLVIIAADHGVAFRPGKNARLDPTPETLQDLMPVPLFVKVPGQAAGATDDRNAQVVDVLPTIVDVLGADPGWKFDGHSLLQGPLPGTKRLVTGDKKSFTRGSDVDWVVAGSRRKYRFTSLPEVPRSAVDDFYAVGPHSSLVGSEIASFRMLPGVRSGLVPEQPNASQEGEPYINGSITASSRMRADSERDVVVAVGGRVGAVARTFWSEGRAKLFATVPPALFDGGERNVELFFLAGGPDDSSVVPLRAR